MTDAELFARYGNAWRTVKTRQDATRARHCEQAQAGYWYCQNTPDDPCGPGHYPHDGHAPGQCA